MSPSAPPAQVQPLLYNPRGPASAWRCPRESAGKPVLTWIPPKV